MLIVTMRRASFAREFHLDTQRRQASRGRAQRQPIRIELAAAPVVALTEGHCGEAAGLRVVGNRDQPIPIRNPDTGDARYAIECHRR